MRKLLLLSAFTFVCLAGYQNCSEIQGSGSGGGTNYPFSTANRYFKTSQKVTVEVYFEPGAEPFVGSTAGGMPYWNILRDNLTAIFQYRSRPVSIVAPTQLSQMVQIPVQGRSAWTSPDLVSLNSVYKQQNPTDTESVFYVYFLNGYFDSGSGASSGVIGVSIGGTPVIGIFKQVVRSTGANPNGPIPKYVEQSTLVHELGHALGFVNNGVPMANPHEDSGHKAHTTNSNSVMYWQNEGASDLVQFVQTYVASGSNVMWGPDVLLDAQRFSE